MCGVGSNPLLRVDRQKEALARLSSLVDCTAAKVEEGHVLEFERLCTGKKFHKIQICCDRVKLQTNQGIHSNYRVFAESLTLFWPFDGVEVLKMRTPTTMAPHWWLIHSKQMLTFHPSHLRISAQKRWSVQIWESNTSCQPLQCMVQMRFLVGVQDLERWQQRLKASQVTRLVPLLLHLEGSLRPGSIS